MLPSSTTCPALVSASVQPVTETAADLLLLELEERLEFSSVAAEILKCLSDTGLSS